MTTNEQSEEGAPLERRYAENGTQHYLGGKLVEEGEELELCLCKNTGQWLLGQFEWIGNDPGRPAFKFHIETGIPLEFWRIKFPLKEYARLRWPR